MKKNYTISIAKTTVWSVLVPAAVILFVVGGAVGIFVVDKLIMPQVVAANRDDVVVPRIAGLATVAGQQKLYDCGLRLQVAERSYTESVPENTIISQSPGPGEKVKKGRPILVVISKGSEVTHVPSIIGLNEYQTRAELRKSWLDAGKIKREYSNSVAKDRVISVTPDVGSAVSKEMPVEVIISKGARPTRCEVPSFVGESLAAAKNALDSCELVLGKVSSAEQSSLAPGMVVSQSVAPGTNVAFGATVDLVVSVGRHGANQ